ncbi:MAG: hypothetical protein WCG84_02485 [Candidatus Moraniibacteriota bacterium]
MPNDETNKKLVRRLSKALEMPEDEIPNFALEVLYQCLITIGKKEGRDIILDARGRLTLTAHINSYSKELTPLEKQVMHPNSLRG